MAGLLARREMSPILCRVPVRIPDTVADFRQCGMEVRWSVYETRRDRLMLRCDCHVLRYWQTPAFCDLVDAGIIRITEVED